ncbi:MAG: cation:proton antiporter [Terriglobia bacterium]
MRLRSLVLCLTVALLVGIWMEGVTSRAEPDADSFPRVGRAASAPQSQQTESQQIAPAESPEKAPYAEGSHTDPFSPILLQLTLIVLAAVIGRWLAGRFNQPSVLGELLIGVVLGNLGYWLHQPVFVLAMHLDSVSEIFRTIWASGLSVADAAQQVFSAAELAPGGVGEHVIQIMTGPGADRFVTMSMALWLFSNLGIILLLFMVGLDSSVEEMLRVGPRAAMVAVVGVVVPFLLGLGAGIWLLPGSSTPVHLFLGATLCATSVGITARVFKDLNKHRTRDAKIILGAAVIDDILGLIILAIVVGIVATGEVHLVEVARISLTSFLFIGGIIVFGEWFVRHAVSLFSLLERHHLKLLFSLTLAFMLSWLASLIGLAPIVGAFAAGLILTEEVFARHSDQKMTAKDLLGPLEAIFAPVFFVLMGMQVNLASFRQPGTLWLALAFTIAAIIGKLVAGVPAGRGSDRLSVGIGMIPRGEVGLIFASIGKGLGVVSDAVFSAVVIMVIVTTLITPVGLKWSLFRRP